MSQADVFPTYSRCPRPAAGAVRVLPEVLNLCYTIHMKRTNLVLDEQLLEEVKRELGLRTYSETVNASLREVLRLRTFEKIDSFAGSDIWEGNLAEMREDSDVSR